MYIVYYVQVTSLTSYLMATLKNKRFLSSKKREHYLTEKVIKEFPPLFDSSTSFLSINL